MVARQYFILTNKQEIKKYDIFLKEEEKVAVLNSQIFTQLIDYKLYAICEKKDDTVQRLLRTYATLLFLFRSFACIEGWAMLLCVKLR